MYLDKINMLLETYAPLKRINKYKSKLWIILGLQKPIYAKKITYIHISLITRTLY